MDLQRFLTTIGFVDEGSADVAVLPASPVRAAHFSTTDLDKVSLADDLFNVTAADFSVVGWFSPTEVETTRYMVGYGAGGAAASFNWYIITSGLARTAFIISDGSGTFQAAYDGSTLGTDWHFFAATFNNTTKEMRMSVDNNTPVSTTATAAVLPALSSTFFVGLGTGFTSAESNFYSTSVGVWSGRILDSDDITEIYNSGVPLVYNSMSSDLKTNILSFYDLDEFSDGSGPVTREDDASTRDLTDTNTTPSIADVPS